METPLFDQINRSSLMKSALGRITDGIVMGLLKPGDKLVEERIAEQLGVSRSPVRDAFHRLEQMGLVEKIPYRGTFVSTLSDSDIEELHVVRSALEGLAAEILAEQCDSVAIERLGATLAEMRQAAERGDRTSIVGLDVDFHDELITLTGNRLLRDIWSPVSLKLRRFILLKRQRMYHTPEEAVKLHEAILQAIASGVPSRASAAVRLHIADAGRAAWLRQPVGAEEVSR